MKNSIFLIFLFLIFSCKKKTDSYSEVILNYKLFSLQVNLDSDYILFSKRQGLKKLGVLPPKIDENNQQSEIDTVNQYIESTFALPTTRIYKFSQTEKSEIESVLNSFKPSDLQGTIDFPQGHCPVFNLILIESKGKVYDIENQCYYSENQEKLKKIIFEIALKNEKDSLNLSILNRSKNLKPHE